jgi:hypothetical protein
MDFTFSEILLLGITPPSCRSHLLLFSVHIFSQDPTGFFYGMLFQIRFA